MSKANPTARAEAAVSRWESPAPQVDVLRTASAGQKRGGGSWVAVQGPHLRTVRKHNPRNKTGVVGISLISMRKQPHRPLRRYFVVQMGANRSSFCLDTLGAGEAWRRAVQARAKHELRIRAANNAILEARERNAQ